MVELEGRVAKLEGFLKAAKKKVTQVINEKAQLETTLQEKIEEITKLVRVPNSKAIIILLLFVYLSDLPE